MRDRRVPRAGRFATLTRGYKFTSPCLLTRSRRTHFHTTGNRFSNRPGTGGAKHNTSWTLLPRSLLAQRRQTAPSSENIVYIPPKRNLPRVRHQHLEHLSGAVGLTERVGANCSGCLDSCPLVHAANTYARWRTFTGSETFSPGTLTASTEQCAWCQDYPRAPTFGINLSVKPCDLCTVYKL